MCQLVGSAFTGPREVTLKQKPAPAALLLKSATEFHNLQDLRDQVLQHGGQSPLSPSHCLPIGLISSMARLALHLTRAALVQSQGH